MKKQSSIESLIEQIHTNLPFYSLLNFDQKLFFTELVKQVKAKHKEEIQDAYDDGCYQSSDFPKTSDAEQYYNETFGGNNE